MMKYMRVAIFVFTVFFVMLLFNSGHAEEPQRPDINKALDSKKEVKVIEVMSLNPEEAFEQLKSADFLIDEDLLHKAIFKTFGYREREGINLALRYLKLPQREIINGKLVDRTEDHFVAKKILNVFPDASVDKLLKLYQISDPVVKKNVIRASGKIAGGKPIKNLLVRALDNKAFCEEEDTEMEGIPLRICDEAYNQLVLRYEIGNVLRTIGNVYTIEVRDYHINILKTRLKESNY